MAPKPVRVRDLAARANLDVDEALLTLWDAGIDEFESASDLIPRRQVPAVMRALGLSDEREQLAIDYWVRTSRLTRPQFEEKLKEHGIRVGPDVRRIPKNSLRRLRRIFDAPPVIHVEEPAPDPLPTFRWETVGQERPCRALEVGEVRAIHEALEEDFFRSADPILPPGVADESLLASAILRSHTSLRGRRKYPTVEMAGAALFHSLIHDHPFYNGNKRTALVGLLAFLDENGLVLTANEQDLFRFTLRTAQHRLAPAHADHRADRETLEIAKWIKSNSRPIDRGERPMKWVHLKQRLREFGCTWAPAQGVGNRLNIARAIRRRSSRLGRLKRVEELTTQVAWAGDGTDAERNTVHKIRRDLELDDSHDVDSATFYGGSRIDAFIIEYRRILQRLAKL